MTSQGKREKSEPLQFMLDEEELEQMKKRDKMNPMEKAKRNVPPGSSPMETPLPWQE